MMITYSQLFYPFMIMIEVARELISCYIVQNISKGPSLLFGIWTVSSCGLLLIDFKTLFLN